MNNENAFAALSREQGFASRSFHERSTCRFSKTIAIHTHAAAYKIAEILNPIAGLLQNRTGKEEQPEVPKKNFCSALM
jgi:hypothetical protein